MRTTKLTKIEKKYTDKRTKEVKTITINYAKVADRILEFRHACPSGKITTELKILDGFAIANAKILENKQSGESGEANGHSVMKLEEHEKFFEKLETLAVGRALAFLGYLAGGEIASSEEMEEFNKFKKVRAELREAEIIDQMNACKNLTELAKVFTGLIKSEQTKQIIELKDNLKLKLSNENSTK